MFNLPICSSTGPSSLVEGGGGGPPGGSIPPSHKQMTKVRITDVNKKLGIVGILHKFCSENKKQEWK